MERLIEHVRLGQARDIVCVKFDLPGSRVGGSFSILIFRTWGSDTEMGGGRGEESEWIIGSRPLTRERERQTDRQAGRQGGGDTDRQRQRDRDRQIDVQSFREVVCVWIGGRGGQWLHAVVRGGKKD